MNTAAHIACALACPAIPTVAGVAGAILASAALAILAQILVGHAGRIFRKTRRP